MHDTVAQGRNVLFVGTKQQARESVSAEAKRSQMHYVNNRWMGGTLTNFKTIKNSIDRLIDYTTRRENDDFEGYTKKELLDIDRKVVKLEASLGGIKSLKKAPDLVFVVDPKLEHIAIAEARKLNIPVVAVVDSNCDPDLVDYVIPANDDAISSVNYFVAKVADACLAGLEKREQTIRMDETNGGKKAGKKPARKRRTADGEKLGKDKSYVAKSVQTQSFEGEATEGFSAKKEETATPVPTKATEEVVEAGTTEGAKETV